MWRHGEYYWLKKGHGGDDEIVECTTHTT
jgi:hypothetical protein